MPDLNIGGVFDLYYVQVLNNSGTYTAPVSDDFRQNAVNGLTPTNNTRLLSGAYATNQTTDNWNSQLRQKEVQI